MTTPTFSVNAASEILEKDRRTLVKALRHVPPDEKVRGGVGRWKLKKILDALEQMQPARPTPVGQIDPRLARLYAQLDAGETTMRGLASLSKRRQFAVATLRPIILETQRMLHVFGRETGRDEEFTNLLADKLYMLALRGWEEPCQWSMDQCWTAMHDDEDDEDA
jgi:hypothetical protein